MKRIYFVIFSLALVSICGQALAGTTTFGKGPVKVTLYTDYFCPPCQALESQAGEDIDRIVKSDLAQVTFVYVPMTQKSVGITVHLLAQTYGKSYGEMMKFRKEMYEMAKRGTMTNDLVSKWVADVKKSTPPYLIQQNLDLMMKEISRYKINSTPTCVIEYPDGTSIKHKGLPDVAKALQSLGKTNTAALSRQ